MVELRPALAQKPGAQSEHEQSNRDVDVEDPRPTERARQRAAEKHAGSSSAPRRSAPDAEREVALPALGERRREDRKRGGRKQGSAEALHRAESDQRALGPGEAVEERADREDGEAEHE